MPNWCNTNIYINYDDEKALKNLYNKIKSWTSKNYADNGFGHGWLGNVVLGAEIGTVDTNPETDISCRGDIEYIDCTNSQITICTETAWSPMLELWIKVIEKYLPDAELIYDACELGNELYATNDPCLVGKYNILKIMVLKLSFPLLLKNYNYLNTFKKLNILYLVEINPSNIVSYPTFI